MVINLLPIVYAVDYFLNCLCHLTFLVLVLPCFYNVDFLKFGERVLSFPLRLLDFLSGSEKGLAPL